MKINKNRTRKCTRGLSLNKVPEIKSKTSSEAFCFLLEKFASMQSANVLFLVVFIAEFIFGCACGSGLVLHVLH